MSDSRVSIEQYLAGKDFNRPWLLEQMFTDQAVVHISTSNDVVALAPVITGRMSIADELSRQFGQTYENIRTFCFGSPPSPQAQTHDCRWMVTMSVKTDRSLRVGWGWYHWAFDVREGHRCAALKIDITQMLTLPASELAPVMSWVDQLDYPWGQASTVVELMPVIEDLAGLRAWLTEADYPGQHHA